MCARDMVGVLCMSGFHLGFCRGGGGKRDNSRVKGDKRLVCFFPSVKNDVLINFIILLGGSSVLPRKKLRHDSRA